MLERYIRTLSIKDAITLINGLRVGELMRIKIDEDERDVYKSEQLSELRLALKDSKGQIELDISDLAIQTIEDGTFADCVSLISIVLPKECTKICRKAFDGCIHIREILVPTHTKDWRVYSRPFMAIQNLADAFIKSPKDSDFYFEDNEVVSPTDYQDRKIYRGYGWIKIDMSDGLMNAANLCHRFTRTEFMIMKGEDYNDIEQ